MKHPLNRPTPHAPHNYSHWNVESSVDFSVDFSVEFSVDLSLDLSMELGTCMQQA